MIVAVTNFKRDMSKEMCMTGKLPEIVAQMHKINRGMKPYIITAVKCHGTTDGPRWFLSWQVA